MRALVCQEYSVAYTYSLLSQASTPGMGGCVVLVYSCADTARNWSASEGLEWIAE